MTGTAASMVGSTFRVTQMIEMIYIDVPDDLDPDPNDPDDPGDPDDRAAQVDAGRAGPDAKS